MQVLGLIPGFKFSPCKKFQFKVSVAQESKGILFSPDALAKSKEYVKAVLPFAKGF